MIDTTRSSTTTCINLKQWIFFIIFKSEKEISVQLETILWHINIFIIQCTVKHLQRRMFSIGIGENPLVRVMVAQSHPHQSNLGVNHHLRDFVVPERVSLALYHTFCSSMYYMGSFLNFKILISDYVKVASSLKLKCFLFGKYGLMRNIKYYLKPYTALNWKFHNSTYASFKEAKRSTV